MSYSFSITASSKDDAAQKVYQALETVIANQPVHARDSQAAQEAAESFINMLAEPGEDEIINVSVSGWLGWRADDEFTSANVSVSAWIGAKT